MHPSYARRRPQMQSNPSSTLHLPSLPRFHPANFPSQGSSVAGTPTSGPNTPPVPVSPRSAQKHSSEAQRALYLYQRELLAKEARASLLPPGQKPESPRLDPLGSPGPVTPLELEEQQGGDYLAAGAVKRKKEEMDKYMRDDTKRYGEFTAKRSVSSVGR